MAYDSPDFLTVSQHLINADYWNANDALWLANQQHYDRKSATLLGFRFGNIQVPCHAEIKNAYLSVNLDLESSSQTDDALTIHIKGEINGEDNLYV